MTTLLDPAPAEAPPPLVGGPRPPGYVGDRIFRFVALAAGVLVLVVLGLIIWATLDNSWEWFKSEGLGIFGLDWAPAEGKYGAGGLMLMTLMVAAIALVISVPVSVGIALFVTEVAPRRARLPIVFAIDLLAAIPSVVFGLWMLRQVAPVLADVYADLHNAASGIPILENVFGDPSASGLAIMTGGIVVGVMITPIVTAITREVFATCPQAQKEATLAMGATRWEMIRGAVFPHSVGGLVGADMLGLGRAMGETVAVALVIGASIQITPNLLAPGYTIPAGIINLFGEASGEFTAALIGMGVILFLVTVVVNLLAQVIVRRAELRMRGAA